MDQLHSRAMLANWGDSLSLAEIGYCPSFVTMREGVRGMIGANQQQRHWYIAEISFIDRTAE